MLVRAVLLSVQGRVGKVMRCDGRGGDTAGTKFLREQKKTLGWPVGSENKCTFSHIDSLDDTRYICEMYSYHEHTTVVKSSQVGLTVTLDGSIRDAHALISTSTSAYISVRSVVALSRCVIHHIWRQYKDLLDTPIQAETILTFSPKLVRHASLVRSDWLRASTVSCPVGLLTTENDMDR